MVMIKDGYGSQFAFSDVLANRRTVEIREIAGKAGTHHRGELPTRDMLRAVYTSEHERGRIAFSVATWKEAKREAGRIGARIVAGAMVGGTHLTCARSS